jgi:hypothetical protein
LFIHVFWLVGIYTGVIEISFNFGISFHHGYASLVRVAASTHFGDPLLQGILKKKGLFLPYLPCTIIRTEDEIRACLSTEILTTS